MVNYYITGSSTGLSSLDSTIYGSIDINKIIPISGLGDQQLIAKLLENNFNVNDKVIIDMLNVANQLNIILNSGYTEYILYYNMAGIDINNSMDCQCTKYGIYKLIFDTIPGNKIHFKAPVCNFSHNNITEMNMQVVNIDTIPENELPEFIIPNVSFEDNSITKYVLPSSSDNWDLNLSYNNITTFELSDINVENLRLNNNSLSSFTIQETESEYYIKSIYLSNCLLKSIDLSKALDLKTIDISYNDLSEISGLSSGLITIILNDNNLINIPENTSWSYLQYLDISNNPLESSSIDLSKFTELMILRISKCGQTSLPTNPPESLTGLDISNSTPTPSFNFEGYENLESLNISNCGCENLNSLSNLTSLTNLDVSRNADLNITKPTEVDITKFSLENLTTLKCSGCKSIDLNAIPENIKELDISYLKTPLNGTAIDLLSKSDLVNLNVAGIYTSNNPLNKITLPDSTTILDISYNYFASMPKVSNIIILSMAGLVINNVAIKSMSTLGLSEKIRKLKMDNNIQITNLDLRSFTRLEQLICKYCRITNLSLPNSIISLDCKGNNISSITYNGSKYTTVPDFYYGLYDQALKPYACFVSLNNLANPEYCTRMTGMGIKNFYPQASSLDFAYNNTKVISSDFTGYQTYKNWCLKLAPNTKIVDQNANIVNYSTTILDRNANVIVDFNGNSEYGNEATLEAVSDQIDKFCSQIDIPNFELIIYWLNISNLLTNNSILKSILDKFAEKQLRTVVYTNDQSSVDAINELINSKYIIPKRISVKGIGNIYYITALDSETQDDIHLVSNFNYEDGKPKIYDIVNSNIIDVAHQEQITYSLTENIPSTYIIEMDITDETNAAKMDGAIKGLYLANSANKDNIIINTIPYSKPSNVNVNPIYRTSYSNGFKLNGSVIYDIPIGKNIYQNSKGIFNEIFLSSLALRSLDLSQVSTLSALDISYNNLSEFSIYSDRKKKIYRRVIDVYNDISSGKFANITKFYNDDNLKLIDIRMNFLKVDNIIYLPYNADIALIYPQKILRNGLIKINGFNPNITNNRFMLKSLSDLIIINDQGYVERIEPEINSNFAFDQSTTDNHCNLYNNRLLSAISLNRIYDFNNIESYGTLEDGDLESILESYGGDGNYYSVFYNIDNIIEDKDSTLYNFIFSFGKIGGTEKMTIYTNTRKAVNAINKIGNSNITAILADDTRLNSEVSNKFNIFLIV